MIVASTDLITHFFLRGESTELAESVLMKDENWAVPILWRSDFRNVLSTLIRSKKLKLENAIKTTKLAENYFIESEYAVSSHKVFEVASRFNLSTYDASYVALAEELDIWLVTNNKNILSTASDVALTMNEFLLSA